MHFPVRRGEEAADAPLEHFSPEGAARQTPAARRRFFAKRAKT
jgi:hypothetical protein